MLVSLTLYSCIVELFDFDPAMYWEHIQTLSAYEQARKWKIAGNKATMRSMGLVEPEKQSSAPNISSADSNFEDDESDDAKSSSSDDAPDDEGSATKWSRCPRHHKALEKDQHARLAAVCSKIVSGKDFGDYHKGKYHVFAERVCKAYAYLWAKNLKDDLHINRENTAEAAVAAVYDQIQPRNDQPHFGTI